jgi:hypothetical protein
MTKIPKVERIRAGIRELVAERPGATDSDMQTYVIGQSSSIRLVRSELVEAGELVEHEGGYYPRGWKPPPPPPPPPPPDPLNMEVCDQCVSAPDPCGRPAAECWEATWRAAGCPMPVPDWEQAGRPPRRKWRARGGCFSYDVAFGLGDCGMANGWVEEACGRADCQDCRLDWPPELCGAVTSKGRLCRRPAGRCGLPGHERVERET